jgi:hypothetical protein
MENLTVQLNRLRSQKAVLENNLRNITQRQRRARTRTLIQMGGLINLTNIPEILGIVEGDDLQIDIQNMDKAAILLGMLMSLEENFTLLSSHEDFERFKTIGLRTLKMHTREKLREKKS